MKKSILYTVLSAVLALSSCSYDEFEDPNRTSDFWGKITLAGSIEQEYNTRANDNGFANGDVIGVYIVDYEGDKPGDLFSKGNRGDNVRHTFNESSYSWTSAYDIYWKDKHTPIDVYGYYPYASPEDVNRYSFSVKTNQARTYDNGAMGDYEASDFLWGKVSKVEPTTSEIMLPFAHKMANARVRLVEGEGFAEGEWSSLKKQVLVTNTVRDCEIDLSTAKITLMGNDSQDAIIPTQHNDEWRAIVVPQNIPIGTVMFNITIDGIPYTFHKNEAFEYVGGKMNNFSIRVDKKKVSGKYTLTLIGESVTAWENDLVSHDAVSKEYVVIKSTPGGLKEAIQAAGKDYRRVNNLKVTGEIDKRDFEFMRLEMSILQSLNIKDVKIVKYSTSEADAIPQEAFVWKTSLNRIILPDKLTKIKSHAFYSCTGLVGSLTIPEGVTTIENNVFYDCSSLTGVLTLPTTLKYIGGSTFAKCNFNCELVLPENLEFIDEFAFHFCSHLYGKLNLPNSLQKIGRWCFMGCTGFTGDLKIPQKLTEIPEYTFNGCCFGGTLSLHDGIMSIGKGAFSQCYFKGELNIPKSLVVIDEDVFGTNLFSGKLVIPADVKSIGDHAFYNNPNLTGIVELPNGLYSINSYAFASCTGIEGLVFPKSLETINNYAFLDCHNINSIVSNAPSPPRVEPQAFYSITKDNFTLEVPESSVVRYQTTEGWNEFKRIAAHHELVCRPQTACALNKEKKQTLILNAEGDWVVESKPDWCSLSQMSGSKKTELTLTISRYAHTSGYREGDIVFKLKDKEYTHTCHVSQYGYVHEENEYIALQTASKGNNGGINIIILGDGYDAKDISSGEYLSKMKQQIEYFFAIEPYASYRDYFNVYTAFPLSAESGVSSMNTIRRNRFSTTANGGVYSCDFDELASYVLKTPGINASNFDRTLVIMVPNSMDYSGITHFLSSGTAVSFCPLSQRSFPYDSRGIVQHEAGGHGFGKLADECVNYNSFVDELTKDYIRTRKAQGWYDNIELTGKMHEVGWSHFIFDPRYSDIVDLFEGGYGFARGVFRSEENSCMNNYIPYFNTISRESIVKRIKRYAGETYNFEDFVEHDKRGVSQARVHNKYVRR